MPDTRVTRSKTQHYALMRSKAPALVAELEEFRNFARSQDPEEPVDSTRLAGIFGKRLALHDEMTETYQPKIDLPGNARRVWERLCGDHPGLQNGSGYETLAPTFRPLVEAYVAGWRGHRLFGLEPEFPNNWQDRRGQDCLISIAADELLNTKSEHEYGMSIWIPRDRLARGLYDEGQFIRHIAV